MGRVGKKEDGQGVGVNGEVEKKRDDDRDAGKRKEGNRSEGRWWWWWWGTYNKCVGKEVGEMR